MSAARPARAEACPCGSGMRYTVCCGRWHAGEPAPTAQALMRSRYAAYVLGLERYLMDTWHPSTRPPHLALDPAVRWLGLDVRSASPLAPDAAGAEWASVEFVARCRVDGRGQRLHETSRFVRENGRWTYVDGRFPGDAAHGAQRSAA